MGGAFRGWTEDCQRFFIGLELDNSKSYFEANRKLYQERVKGPLEALLAELEPEFGRGKITRPNRDIRFSNDKSPYKTRIYATAERGGYVGLDAKGLSAGAGHYELDKDQLEDYRAAVVADQTGSRLLAVVHKLEAGGYEVGGGFRLVVVANEVHVFRGSRAFTARVQCKMEQFSAKSHQPITWLY